MSVEPSYGVAGRVRSPATLPGYHAGRVPPNKGVRYPADPPMVDEIVAVMRQAGEDRHGRRMRALIVVLWRAGCGSTRRSRSPRLTLMSAAEACSFATGRETGGARSGWTRGGGRFCAPEDISDLATARSVCSA